MNADTKIGLLLALALPVCGYVNNEYYRFSDSVWVPRQKAQAAYIDAWRSCGEAKARLVEQDGKHEIWLCTDGVRRHIEHY